MSGTVVMSLSDGNDIVWINEYEFEKKVFEEMNLYLESGALRRSGVFLMVDNNGENKVVFSVSQNGIERIMGKDGRDKSTEMRSALKDVFKILEARLLINDNPSIVLKNGKHTIFDCDKKSCVFIENEVIDREDGPAIVIDGVKKCYYENGERSRKDGPAVEFENGDKEWWSRGLLHREDGPAVEYGKSKRMWYRNGLLHREDGPAVDDQKNEEIWCLNGLRHRVNGPAKISFMNGLKKSESWYQNGKLHRYDGPAVITFNEDEKIEKEFFYMNGEPLSKFEFEEKRTLANDCDSDSFCP